MNIVDIGGGFPGYDDGGMSFEDMAAVINGALNVHFPEGDDVTIIAEPGRFYAAKAFTLACTVMAKTKCAAARIVKDGENKETGYMYYINDGVYGSFNCLIYDHGVADPKTLFDVSSCTMGIVLTYLDFRIITRKRGRRYGDRHATVWTLSRLRHVCRFLPKATGCSLLIWVHTLWPPAHRSTVSRVQRCSTSCRASTCKTIILRHIDKLNNFTHL